MNKPYIICHMMTSVDGRIDCAMTEHLPGVQEYYDTLDALDAPHPGQRTGDGPAGDGLPRHLPQRDRHPFEQGSLLQGRRRRRI